MRDELVAGLPLLIGVVTAREDEGAGHLGPIDQGLATAVRAGDLRLELVDDRDQVVEQGTLARREPRGQFIDLFDCLRNSSCSFWRSI